MFNHKREIPGGMEDILIDKRRLLTKVEDNLRRLYLLNGYNEVQTPTFEYYDVFASLDGVLQPDKMFKFLDSRGRILVLRPDMTTPIARMVATKFRASTFPLRLSYNANVFRIDPANSGREHEFIQSGVELLGVHSPVGDAEVVYLAIKSLLSQGIKGFQIDLGHNGFYQAVIKGLTTNPERIGQLQQLIESKNMVGLEEFLFDCDWDDNIKALLKALPLLFGKAEEVLAKLKQFQLDPVMEHELAKLEDTLALLKDYGVAQYTALDLGLVSEMNYYTGLIFRGLVKDVGYTVLSGGRYDKLVGHFGRDCPATGFAINVNRLVQALEKQAIPSGTSYLGATCDEVNRKELINWFKLCGR